MKTKARKTYDPDTGSLGRPREFEDFVHRGLEGLRGESITGKKGLRYSPPVPCDANRTYHDSLGAHDFVWTAYNCTNEAFHNLRFAIVSEIMGSYRSHTKVDTSSTKDDGFDLVIALPKNALNQTTRMADFYTPVSYNWTDEDFHVDQAVNEFSK